MLADHKVNKKQEILLMGGDIHIGGHTEVYKNGSAIFRQIITSGVGQRTKEKLKPFYERIISQTDLNLGGGFSFKHHDWTYNRNYTTLEMKLTGKIPVIESYLTISDKNIKPTKQNVVSKGEYSLDRDFKIQEFFM